MICSGSKYIGTHPGIFRSRYASIFMIVRMQDSDTATHPHTYLNQGRSALLCHWLIVKIVMVCSDVKHGCGERSRYVATIHPSLQYPFPIICVASFDTVSSLLWRRSRYDYNFLTGQHFVSCFFLIAAQNDDIFVHLACSRLI